MTTLISFLSDPGFVLTIRWTLALVFILAVIHKLGSPAGFQAILANYRLLPGVLVLPASYFIIVTELFTIAWLVLNRQLGSLLAAFVLAFYTSAIVINLIRGRIDIDCGCSGPAVRQSLNGWLVVRNIGLISLALTSLVQTSVRPLVTLDWLTTLAAVATFAFIYTTAAQLSAVSARYHQ